MDSSNKSYKKIISEEALRLGFSYCGFSKADFLEEEAPRLEKWLNDNYHGEMSYMANHFDIRLDPRLLVDNAKTVVSLLLNYYTDEPQNPDAPKLSKYAYGEDYHFVIKDKLKSLLAFIQDEIGEVNGRVFVDSAPVMDKAWAVKGGLGWMGKNTNIINKTKGSFFFIAELIIDLELEPDNAVLDHCGTCTACIDACPTQAIIAPYQIDGSKCISYFTIELKESIPNEMKGKMDDWMFGCDVCQDVCPWNRFSIQHNEERFRPHPDLLDMTKDDWNEMNELTFNKVFKKSAVKRTKFSGLKRNLDFLK
ncbi:MAG: tRNA epoxyqueuosine(34) reductase QueG [Flavobacteriales bacterium]|nr:tRNA epoxyqueuosine(34) reductase QueG [Flavobacteriales bacterium]MBL6872883.1 tRNA epoxyqueuosine(34) reductase QueG [Flavobacteriales bacterium]